MNSKNTKRRDRTVGSKERQMLSHRRENLNLSLITDQNISIGSKQPSVKITIPKSFVKTSKQQSRVKADADREFTKAFEEHQRRSGSKVFRQDSVSSNSVIDRIDTNKINVGDILGEDDFQGSSYQRMLAVGTQQSKGSKGSKQRKIKVDKEEDLGAEMPESESISSPLEPKSKPRRRDQPKSKKDKEQSKSREPLGNSKNQQASKHVPIRTAGEPKQNQKKQKADQKEEQKARQKSSKKMSDNSNDSDHSKDGNEESGQKSSGDKIGNKNGARKPRRYVDITQEEIDEILAFEKNMERMVSELDPSMSIFKTAPLKRFFTHTMAELNPVLSVSSITLDFYERIFSCYMLPRVCFAYWDIQNDQQEYEHWPEALKMEVFLDRAWKENYENDVKAKFIYSMH